ncbi:unnamed protein product [Acanthosepion pharaonis]|uniref:Uncharacterized protein n=1 Tax=Acanthosepion pharaonis TaxID=158019 RepID=A0A812DYQ9_ACAPH|nr:unnamed protein product [Sepia pharaonis]
MYNIESPPVSACVEVNLKRNIHSIYLSLSLSLSLSLRAIYFKRKRTPDRAVCRLPILLDWTWTQRATPDRSWLCLVTILAASSKRIHARLISVRPSLPRKTFATLIRTYAPTMTNLDEVKYRFYEDLKDTILAVPRTDKLIIIGYLTPVWTEILCCGRERWENTAWASVRATVFFCWSPALLMVFSSPTVFRLPKRNKTQAST